MHFYGSIPFAALMGAAVLTALSVSWRSERRDTRAMSAIFACAGAWAFLELLVQLASGPREATFWLRLVHVPPLFFGPLTIAMLVQVLPQCEAELRPWARYGFTWSILLASGCVFLPGVVTDAIPTGWGDWMPQYGVVSIALFPLGAFLPAVAARVAIRARARAEEPADRVRSRATAVVVWLTVAVSGVTELALPLLEIPAPRLGALTVVLGAGVMWLHVLHESDDLGVTPHRMARAVLSELQVGVALVRLDGTILSANGRLAELAGRRSSTLMGMGLEAIVDLPLEIVVEGVEDRETRLLGGRGEGLPVALSSSIAHDRRSGPIGMVVVFRDLRDVDMLRRQLLTSGRLAAIGELAAGIAHEVNNPVAYIRADLNYLEGRLAELQEKLVKEAGSTADLPIFATGPGRVERAIQGIERIAEVVGDVRDFAHVGGLGQGGSDPRALLEGALRLARLERGDEVEIRVQAEPIHERLGSGQELKQVLLALLRLLVTGTASGGRIDVGLEAQGGELGIRLRGGPLIEETSALVARFGTTRVGAEDSSRSDLGLAVAAELVEQMGGSLSVVAVDERAILVELTCPLEEGDEA